LCENAQVGYLFEVLYIGVNGDDLYEIGINQLTINGGHKPVTLHDEAVLFAVAWGDISPFDVLQFSWLNYGY
jgi:hypothetical protein